MAKGIHGVSRTLAVIVAAIVIVGAIAGGYFALNQSTASTMTSSTFSSSSATSASSSSSANSVLGNSSSAQLTPATFMLDFVPLGYHGMFYYGFDHGIYAQNGIDLTIEGGHGSVGTIEAVAAGKVDFGFADPSALIVAAASGNISNVRIISAVFQRTFLGIVYNKATISNVSSLDGKNMATFQGNGAQKLFTVFGQVNHLNLSSISYVYTTPAQFNGLVALGKADAYIGGVDGMAEIASVAAQNNIQLGAFPYADYGLPLYGSALITTSQMISSHPDLVQRFVNATLQSTIAAIHHPGDAINSLIKYNPQLSYNVSMNDMEITIQTAMPNINSSSYILNPLTLGCVNSSRMQTTINMVSAAYGFTTQPSPSDIYTNNFVSCS